MKKIFFILFVFWSLSGFTQKEKDDEKIKALKTAYITETLDLNSKEAEKFWPIYNTYETKKDSIYGQKWCEVKNGLDDIKNIDEEEANQLLEEYFSLKEESLIIKKEFYQKLKKVISSKKILMLKKAEHDFHKILLEKYGENK